MPRISLVEDLTTGAVPSGSNILVEFDGASQWHNACLAIAAEWLRQEGRVSYNTHIRFPDDIRSKLKSAGLNVETLEAEDKLRIWDWYSATLGKKSTEKYAYDSLKVPDLSIRFAKEDMDHRTYQLTGWIRIVDNISTLGRFNEEKAWVEFLLTRGFPSVTLGGRTTTLHCILRGVHGNWAYEQLEAASDGTIEFRVEKVGQEWRNFVAIKNMRDVGYDSRSHPFTVNENLQVTLEK